MSESVHSLYRHPSRLGRRLVFYIVLFSTVITLCLTAIELIVDYRKDVASIEERLQQIEVGTVSAIAGSVWTLDQSALQTQLALLLRIPDIRYVALDTHGLMDMQFGAPETQDPLAKTYPLTHEKQGQSLPVGALTLHASKERAHQRLWERLWIILAGQALRTLLVSGFILLLFHRLVTRHLMTIAEFAYQAHDYVNRTPLQLEGRRPSLPDELDLVVDMFNGMREANFSLYQDVAVKREQLQGILDNTTAVIYMKDTANRYLLVNRMFEQLYGVNNAEVAGKTDHDLFPATLADAMRANDLCVLAADEPIEREETIAHHASANTYLSARFPLKDRTGKTYAVCGIFTDITRRIHAENSLFEEKERAQVTLDSIGDAVITTDIAGRIHYLNPVAERLTGWYTAEVAGLPLVQVFKVINETSRASVRNPVQLVLEHGKTVALANHSVLICRDGTEVPIEDSGAPIRDRNGTIVGVVLVFHDVSVAHDMAKQLQYQATHDLLTGLPNRKLLLDRFDHAASVASRNQQRLALLFLDLDHFKNVNDSLGHPAGDKLLQQVAARLVTCVSAGHTVSRQGGDEFVVLVESIDSTDVIAVLAARIIATLSERYFVEGHELTITPSIGISIYPDDALNVDDMIKSADAAMYLAKAKGRNNFQLFTPDMRARAFARLELENALRKALIRQEFLLYYQPKICLATGKTVSAEALVRWRDPQRGLVSPADFIPVAEECGLVLPLGHWVLHEACRQATAWQVDGQPSIQVAVNLSAAQFKKADLVLDVATVLAETGLAPALLELELTESMMMDGNRDLETMNRLKSLGVGLSIDDFGTGYSSLNYLRYFPVDVLKIDQSFIRNMENEEDAAAMVRGIITLGHNLRLKIIAEGVENESQIKILRSYGCDQIQGYYYSRPLPEDEFRAYLRKDQADQ